MAALDRQSDPTVIWDLLSMFHGTRAFDIGANGGMVARKLAARFSEVVAFEPCEESFDQLAHSVPENVTPVPLAVSDVDGLVMFNTAEVTDTLGELVTGDSLAESWGPMTGTRSVPAVTLDEAVDRYGVPDFVKIDTEGHEVRVIRGGLTVLNMDRPMLMIEVHAAANGPEIEELTPGYLYNRVDHDGYPPDSYGRANHFYLLGVPK